MVTLQEYSEKIGDVNTLDEKLDLYQLLNWELGLYNDDEITVEWLPSDDDMELILIKLEEEKALLTVKYTSTHRIFKNIEDINLKAEKILMEDT